MQVLGILDKQNGATLCPARNQFCQAKIWPRVAERQVNGLEIGLFAERVSRAEDTQFVGRRREVDSAGACENDQWRDFSRVKDLCLDDLGGEDLARNGETVWGHGCFSGSSGEAGCVFGHFVLTAGAVRRLMVVSGPD
ncbi:hypothetical protein [Amycolatopsis sp. NPDC059657]|uniref:hypothetical protein n=1 Tax=Amycolatopsis sp. NPDC059657 TaxID=3346899 RepID=UPI003670E6AA